MNLFALALAALVSAAPLMANAADGPSPAEPAKAEAVAPVAPAANPGEKVCKVERELGSNKMKRVCRTRAQIENDRQAARETLTREQRR